MRGRLDHLTGRLGAARGLLLELTVPRRAVREQEPLHLILRDAAAGQSPSQDVVVKKLSASTTLSIKMNGEGCLPGREGQDEDVHNWQLHPIQSSTGRRERRRSGLKAKQFSSTSRGCGREQNKVQGGGGVLSTDQLLVPAPECHGALRWLRPARQPPGQGTRMNTWRGRRRLPARRRRPMAASPGPGERLSPRPFGPMKWRHPAAPAEGNRSAPAPAPAEEAAPPPASGRLPRRRLRRLEQRK